MSMTDWYEKSMRALQLAGKEERTQEAYTRAVRKLVEFYDKTPDQISETELQDYFLHRRNVDGWSPNTLRICHAGIRFFFTRIVPFCSATGAPMRASSTRPVRHRGRVCGGLPGRPKMPRNRRSNLPKRSR